MGSLKQLMQVMGKFIVSAPLTIDGGNNADAGAGGFSNCGNPGVTNTTNAVASGGKPPFNYQWTLVSAAADKGPWVPVDSTDPSTIFGGSSNVCDGEVVGETWEIEVTDDDLDTATDTIFVNRVWVNIS